MPALARLLAGCLALPLLLAAVPARAAAPGDDAFSIMREQMVTGVSKRPLPLSESPSSVTVISAAEVRAMGYHSLADALRWVRGAFVTYDRNYAYAGVRGMQRIGDYNDKILVTIDGHTLNGSVYADAYLGPELGLDLEQVERIEIVRGPGSALYGSYAVIAVVNVVTRKPRSSPPAAASLRAGGAGEWLGSASFASSRAGLPEWKLDVSWLQAQGRPLSYFDPVVVPSPVLTRDGERAASAFATLRWGGVDLSAKFNDRKKVLTPASWGLVNGSTPSASWDGHDFVEASTARSLGRAVEVSVRAYWDRAHYHAVYFLPADPGLVENDDLGDGHSVGAEVRAHWAPLPYQALTFGHESQRSFRTHLLNVDRDPRQVWFDYWRSGDLVAWYLQDEARLGSALIVTAGARLDNDSRFRAVVTPRADLVWTVTPGTRLKVLGGSAFRAPSPFEIVSRSPDLGELQPERVVTYEATLEREMGPVLTLVTAYRSHFRDLIDLLQLDPEGNTAYTNLSRVGSRGIEGEVRVTPRARTHARLAAAWQQSEIVDTGEELSNSPRWNLHALAYRTLRDERTTLGGGLRYLSGRIAYPGRRTAAVMVADVRLARSMAGLSVGLEARNLFDARCTDPTWGEYVGQEIRQDPRSVYLTVSYPASGAR